MEQQNLNDSFIPVGTVGTNNNSSLEASLKEIANKIDALNDTIKSVYGKKEDIVPEVEETNINNIEEPKIETIDTPIETEIPQVEEEPTVSEEIVPAPIEEPVEEAKDTFSPVEEPVSIEMTPENDNIVSIESLLSEVPETQVIETPVVPAEEPVIEQPVVDTPVVSAPVAAPEVSTQPVVEQTPVAPVVEPVVEAPVVTPEVETKPLASIVTPIYVGMTEAKTGNDPHRVITVENNDVLVQGQSDGKTLSFNPAA